jgi:hypothetical protein
MAALSDYNSKLLALYQGAKDYFSPTRVETLTNHAVGCFTSYRGMYALGGMVSGANPVAGSAMVLGTTLGVATCVGFAVPMLFSKDSDLEALSKFTALTTPSGLILGTLGALLDEDGDLTEWLSVAELLESVIALPIGHTGKKGFLDSFENSLLFRDFAESGSKFFRDSSGGLQFHSEYFGTLKGTDATPPESNSEPTFDEAPDSGSLWFEKPGMGDIDWAGSDFNDSFSDYA